MFVKIHKSYRDIIAICDSDLIGKKFEQGESQLDIKEDFFKGEEKSAEEVMRIMTCMNKEDATFNIAGKESVECALQTRIINKQGIKEIQGVPFALVLL